MTIDCSRKDRHHLFIAGLLHYSFDLWAVGILLSLESTQDRVVSLYEFLKHVRLNLKPFFLLL